MNIDIRKHIKDNFKDANTSEIRSSIESSIRDNDEITLPGIGVLFEILWTNSDETNKEHILSILQNSLKA